MSYLYLAVAIWLAFLTAHVTNNTLSNITLRFPAIAFSVTFGILAAKSFGLV